MSNLKQLSSFSVRKLLKSIFYTLAPPGSKLGGIGQRAVIFFRRHFRRLNRDYQKWIVAYNLKKGGEIGNVAAGDNPSSPDVKFSILMPVYNPRLDLLDEAIQSVRDQTYTNWELCIADDASSLPGVKDVVNKHLVEDQRILVDFREENGNISEASNSALKLTTGNYLVLFDHDDKLHPNALEYAANVISKHPTAEIIYSDRDKITVNGERYDPYFKPDFDYELLLHQNYISHLDIYRSVTVKKIGGFRAGFEGAQDYDLLLRILEIIDKNEIFHLPQVLYHWRASSRSVASSLLNKQYAIDAGRKALSEHLTRKGVNGIVSFKRDNSVYQIDYVLPGQAPLVEIIILSNSTESRVAFVKDLLGSTEYNPLRITLGIQSEGQNPKSIDSISDPSLFIADLKPGSGSIENLHQLITKSEAEIICVLNEDIRGFSNGWLKKLVSQCLQKDVGIVGPKLLGSTGKIYSDGMILNLEQIATQLFHTRNKNYGGYYNWGHIQREYSAITGQCVLFTKNSFVKVDGLNENLSNLKSAWLDFCLKMKAHGMRNIFVPSVTLQLIRIPEVEDITEDRDFFISNWKNWIINDPAFNPNLVQQNNEIIINLSKIEP